MSKPKETNEKEMTKGVKPTFVRSSEGAILYGMGEKAFIQLGREANAVYRYKNFVMYKTERIDAYMEAYRDNA